MELNNSIEFVFFAKFPRKGHVKTRLFPDFPNMSLQLYRAFIKDFAKRYSKYSSIPLRPLLDCSNDEEEQEFLKLIDPISGVLKPIIQKDLSFFERLAHGILEVETPYFHLTGSDLPHFPFHFLIEEPVETKDDLVTIGPDRDGGFYFLSGPKKCAQVFLLPIKRDNIFKSLVRNFQSEGYRVKVLKYWSDIDTAEDLDICLNQFCANELPNTYRTLSGFGRANEESLAR